MNDLQKSTRTLAIDHINAARAQLNQLERLVWAYIPDELPAETLYKWDMIPAGYDYAACDEDVIYCYTVSPISYNENHGHWFISDETEHEQLPLSVLNRLGVEPALSLEKRPGVE